MDWQAGLRRAEMPVNLAVAVVGPPSECVPLAESRATCIWLAHAVPDDRFTWQQVGRRACRVVIICVVVIAVFSFKLITT